MHNWVYIQGIIIYKVLVSYEESNGQYTIEIHNTTPLYRQIHIRLPLLSTYPLNLNADYEFSISFESLLLLLFSTDGSVKLFPTQEEKFRNVALDI
jgi:hypothetical protein